MTFPKVPSCPECGNLAHTNKTRWGYRHECPRCGLRSWNGKPLVHPDVLAARRRAHAVFDQLWKHGACDRGRAYFMLAEELGVTEAEAHMSVMSLELAERVPAAVRRIRKRLRVEERRKRKTGLGF